MKKYESFWATAFLYNYFKSRDLKELQFAVYRLFIKFIQTAVLFYEFQVAGMVAYYVVTKGKHPFGEEADRLRNLLDGKPVGLERLLDPGLKHLLSWMLSHDPYDRPSAEEALKHPYLQTAEEKFEMFVQSWKRS